MNKKTFISLIQEHKRLINKLVFTYARTPEDQDDLRQEILLQAWKSFPHFQAKSKFSTWLFRVGINTGLTYQRKKKKELVVASEERFPGLSSEDISNADLLKAILSSLNPVEKTLIIATIEGYDQQEIATMMGISPGNVRVKLFRIRKKLEEYGVKRILG
ncbi:MAG: RNA polymerase sigma factor [Bacteroidota bacterium]